MDTSLESEGITDLRFRVLRKDIKGYSVLKSLNPSISAKKDLKTNISYENVKIFTLSAENCKNSFYQQIMKKYDFFKKTGRLFPDLVFFKLVSSNPSVTNIKILKTGNRYFKPHFNLTFYLIGRRKVRTVGGISQSNNLLPFSQEQAKPNPGTSYQKLTNLGFTFALFSIRNETRSFYSIYRYLTARNPRTFLFQKSFNFPPREKLFFKKLLLSTDNVTSIIPKVVSKDNNILAIQEKYKSINGRKDEIKMEKDIEVWNTRESRALGFRHLEPDKKRSSFPQNVPLPQIFKDGLLLSKNDHMDIQESENSAHLSRLGTLSMVSGILGRKHQQNINPDDNEVLSKTPRISGKKIQSPKYVNFLKTVELKEQEPDFLTWKLRHRQKSNMSILTVNKYSKVEKEVSHDTSHYLKNVDLQYVSSYKDASITQVEMRDKRKVIYEGGQDMVLRKFIMPSSKELSGDIEENLSGHTSKGNINSLQEKNNSYFVSSDDINTIVNKVYRLLETKLLIEKERRGLR